MIEMVPVAMTAVSILGLSGLFVAEKKIRATDYKREADQYRQELQRANDDCAHANRSIAVLRRENDVAASNLRSRDLRISHLEFEVETLKLKVAVETDHAIENAAKADVMLGMMERVVHSEADPMAVQRELVRSGNVRRDAKGRILSKKAADLLDVEEGWKRAGLGWPPVADFSADPGHECEEFGHDLHAAALRAKGEAAPEPHRIADDHGHVFQEIAPSVYELVHEVPAPAAVVAVVTEAASAEVLAVTEPVQPQPIPVVMFDTPKPDVGHE